MSDPITLLEAELAQLTQQLADLPAPVPQPTPPDPSHYTDPAALANARRDYATALGEWRDLYQAVEDVRGILKASLEAKQTELAIAKATQQGQPKLNRLHSLAKEFNAQYGQALRLWNEIEATAKELQTMGFPNPPGEPHLVVLEWKRPTPVAVGLRPRGLVMGGGLVVREVHEGKSIAKGDFELLPLQE